MPAIEKFCACVLLALILNVCHASGSPVVDTPLGKVRGTYKKSFSGKTYAAFQGIPYAKPPVGELRFEPPQEVDPWPGTWHADQLHTCVQRATPFTEAESSVSGSEDCLYVNVYTPRRRPTTGDNLEVLVHFHGGAYMVGSGHFLVNPDFIMDRDFVFVTLNYRLAALGFLSTQDGVVPGNNGLKDQAFALKWIQENIKYFGGNPGSVTLTGFSAGGSSTHYHYLSPLSKGLFHRGYSFSGNVLCPSAYQREPVEKFRRLASYVGCYEEGASTKTIVDCLKKRPASHIVDSYKHFQELGFYPMNPFGPIAETKSDGAFLTDLPHKLLQEGKIHKLPWINSNTEQDLAMVAGMLEPQADVLEDKWDEFIHYLMDTNYTVAEKDKTQVARKIKDFYLGNEKLSKETWLKLAEMLNDRLVLNDAVRSYLLQSEHAPVYNILYGYKPTVTMASLFFETDFDYGVLHGDDIILVFASNPKGELSETDAEVKNLLLDTLQSFAKTSVLKVGSVTWDDDAAASSDGVPFVVIKGPSDVSLQKKTEQLEKMQFWDSLSLKEHQNLLKQRDEL
ncbi:carboxylesterase [Rhyzopertha dominica]|nr:carboxylesterase [Rhyzopertha dominica]